MRDRVAALENIVYLS